MVGKSGYAPAQYAVTQNCPEQEHPTTVPMIWRAGVGCWQLGDLRFGTGRRYFRQPLAARLLAIRFRVMQVQQVGGACRAGGGVIRCVGWRRGLPAARGALGLIRWSISGRLGTTGA